MLSVTNAITALGERDRNRVPYVPAFTYFKPTERSGTDDMCGIDVWVGLNPVASDLIGLDEGVLPMQIKSSMWHENTFLHLAADLERRRKRRSGCDGDRRVLMLNGARRNREIRTDCALGLVQFAGLRLKAYEEVKCFLECCFHPEIVQTALKLIEQVDPKMRRGFDGALWPNQTIQGTVVYLPRGRVYMYNGRAKKN